MEHTNPTDIKTTETGDEQTTIQLGLTDETGKTATALYEAQR